MLILAFLVGWVVGFLVCAAWTVDMLKKRGLFVDGDVLDLRHKDKANDSSI